MSATPDQRESAKAARDDWNKKARALGHDMRWKLGANATRKGHYYFFDGTCAKCQASITVGAGGSSSSGVRDGRREKCPGATSLEDARRRRAMSAAVRQFAHEAGL